MRKPRPAYRKKKSSPAPLFLGTAAILASIGYGGYTGYKALERPTGLRTPAVVVHNRPAAQQAPTHKTEHAQASTRPAPSAPNTVRPTQEVPAPQPAGASQASAPAPSPSPVGAASLPAAKAHSLVHWMARVAAQGQMSPWTSPAKTYELASAPKPVARPVEHPVERPPARPEPRRIEHVAPRAALHPAPHPVHKPQPDTAPRLPQTTPEPIRFVPIPLENKALPPASGKAQRPVVKVSTPAMPMARIPEEGKYAEPSGPVPPAKAPSLVQAPFTPKVLMADGQKAWVQVSPQRTVIFAKGTRVPALGVYEGGSGASAKFTP